MTAHALDHVALAVQSWDVAGPVLAGTLGGRWRHGFRLETMNNCQLAFGNDTRVELLEPGTAPDSFVGKFLAASGGASRPHHITFKVADIEKSLRVAEREGFAPTLVNIGNPVWREYFLHPKATGLGFLAQVVESSAEPRELNPEGSLPEPWPSPAVGPVDLDFVLAQVVEVSEARRVLTGVLGAVETAVHLPGGGRGSRFSWPAGADLVLADADHLPGRPGIQALGVAPVGPLDLAVTPTGCGYARTAPLAALGLQLLIRQVER